MTDEPVAYAEFKKALAAAQRKGVKDRLGNSPPIGMLPDGTLNLLDRLRLPKNAVDVTSERIVKTVTVIGHPTK
jgi:hypothetical protein